MKRLTTHKHKFLFIALLFIIMFTACQKDKPITPDIPESHQRCDISKIQSMEVYSPAEVQQLLDESGAAFPFELDYGVEAFSVDYYSINAKGEMILVSGALYIPQSNADLPLLSIQHGTESKREQVASVSPQSSVEGIIGLMTASMGYVTIIPDYTGFGISKVNHPYMHQASLVPSVVDLIIAGKSYCSANQIKLNEQLFLMGYSEGGLVSLATQKAIEENYSEEFTLTAVAPASGPYDLSGMFDTIFNAASYSSPVYIAYFFNAYDDIYGWNRLDEIFNSPYADIIPGLFDGSKSWGQVENQLPASFQGLINHDFVDAYLSGNEQSLTKAVAENTLLDWVPKTPLHFIHGDADMIVPYHHALTATDRLSANGVTNIELTSISGGTHASSGPEAIRIALEWFQEF